MVGLNDDVFPLNTSTYPVTKNIKAELAGVVIIAVFGAVSQMRVWKMVKEHRAKSAAQQLERQQDQEREEEALGRKIEDNFQKERAQWEAAYGGRSVQNSSIRSSVTGPKGSTSIQEKEVYGTDGVELVSMSKGGVMRSTNNDMPTGTTVTVSVLQDDDIQQIDAQGKPILYKQTETITAPNTSSKALPNTPGTSPSDVVLPSATKRTSLRPSAPPPPPAVVPLPFTIPKEEDSKSEQQDNASVSAVPETDHEVDADRRPISKRISDMSAIRQRISRNISESQEALINVPHVEDDRASSVAATFDEDDDNLSLRQLSPPHSPIGTEHDTLPETSSMKRKKSETEFAENSLVSNNATAQTASDALGATEVSRISTTDKKPHVPSMSSQNENRDVPDITLANESAPPRPTIRQSLTTSTDPKPDEPPKQHSSLRDARIRADTLVSSTKGSSDGQQSKPTKSDAPSQNSQSEPAESHVGSLQDGLLTQRLSRVALSYRTNEWAKHLEVAEKPELDDLREPGPQGVILDGDQEEVAAPVSAEIASPLLGSKRKSRRASVESKANRNSGVGLNRSASTFSQESLVDLRSSTRSPPVMSPGVLSRSNSGTRLDALSPLPSNTLMSQRENLMKNRVSSQSLTPHTSSANLLAEHGEQENVTLAARRQLLQHQTSVTSQRKAPPSTSQKWQNKGWAVKGAPAGFDSHQPKRSSSSQSDQKREELYASWRDTMRDVTPPQTAAYMAEQQRIALMNERRHKEAEKQQREMMQQQRTSQMDSMMRSGQMLDAHREAMRRMQANANKRA